MAADTFEQAQARETDKELLLSRSRAIAAACGGETADASVINQEAQIERQGEFYKALEMFGGLEEYNQRNYASQNAVLEGINRANAKGYQAGQIRRATKLQAMGTILSEAGQGLYKYRRRLPFGPSDTDVAIGEGRRDAAKVWADYAASKLARQGGF